MIKLGLVLFKRCEWEEPFVVEGNLPLPLRGTTIKGMISNDSSIASRW